MILKKAGKIHSESRRDKFFIENIESLQGNSYFTDFKVRILKKRLNLTTRYGSVNADLIEKGFEALILIQVIPIFLWVLTMVHHTIWISDI